MAKRYSWGLRTYLNWYKNVQSSIERSLVEDIVYVKLNSISSTVARKE